MTPARESNSLNYRRRLWLQTAICPHCAEENTAQRSMLITLTEEGIANCGNCSRSWKPDVYKGLSGRA